MKRIIASIQPGKPPAPRSIDEIIHRRHGSTVAVDLMPSTLQASKDEPTPSLKEMIEALSRENGRLREELAYRQDLQELGEQLQHEVDYIIERLKMAVMSCQRGQEDVEKEFRGAGSTRGTC